MAVCWCDYGSAQTIGDVRLIDDCVHICYFFYCYTQHISQSAAHRAFWSVALTAVYILSCFNFVSLLACSSFYVPRILHARIISDAVCLFIWHFFEAIMSRYAWYGWLHFFLATTVDSFTSPPMSSRQLLHSLFDNTFLGDIFKNLHCN